ncbi:hypothetical protein ACLB2K_006907 [Fragaria x ananassa]
MMAEAARALAQALRWQTIFALLGEVAPFFFQLLATADALVEEAGPYVVQLPATVCAFIGMAPFEELYGCQCRTPLCWNEVGEKEFCGPEIIQDTNEKIKVIRDRLKAAQNRQKSYTDNRMKDLEFQVGDWVFLKLSLWKGVVRFGKRGNLSPRYIGPYEVIERVGAVAYRLELPLELSRIHNVFHESMLRKYIAEPSHILQEQPISLKKNLTYEEEPVQILDRKDQVLRNKAIPLVKVLWRSHQIEEATWEPEEQLRQQYPYLFE